MLPPVFGVLFDGIAYGMLLFVLSVGLSVTLGLMNFVNLAHCAFAMLGGYVTVTLVNELQLAVPRDAAGGVPVAAAIVSVAFERVFYRRLYRASDLDQVLLTIGIAFVSVAVAAYHLRHHPAADRRRRPFCAARSIFSASTSATTGCFWSALRWW